MVDKDLFTSGMVIILGAIVHSLIKLDQELKISLKGKRNSNVDKMRQKESLLAPRVGEQGLNINAG